MTKWVVLAVGVLLSANGFYTRTFPNDTSVRYAGASGVPLPAR